MASINTLQSFYDISLYGSRTTIGAIEELYNVEAFENSILLWLTSQQGDYLRNPTRGGYIMPHLTKPMSPDRVRDIKDAIITGLKDDYEKLVIVQQIIINPDYDNRLYNITIKAFAKDIKEYLDVQAILKSLN